MGDQRLNLAGLDQLLKALKDKSKPFIRIGILGGNASTPHKTVGADGEEKTGSTNAEVGAAHEYGTEHLPVRSFLRVPLKKNLNKALEASGALDKRTFENVVKEGSIIPWLTKVSVLAEGCVANAFNTSEDGNWPESNMERKNNHQTLVESQQLRDSITSEIKRGG